MLETQSVYLREWNEKKKNIMAVTEFNPGVPFLESYLS